MEKSLGRLHFNFTPENNGGESLYINTEFFDNGDEDSESISYRQELTLASYCNGATFNLIGSPLTPAMLRKLADALDSKLAELKSANNKK